ncbi:AAA family ATPase [Agromyces allii]|uniref:Multifunctional transcriptional regulator/nicotinamide-nucleotide adenylyltransferase/ribosylnicotinamide kinase NadR n=1 Tax=Agromyces allii TaxID=393607 RepID=A0ABN2PYR3_9MICO|nr:AAA family ATPase [Agromyces allii]
MTREPHGLIIGKFYPLHAGHLALIRYAAQHADRITVLVMGSTFETMSLADRQRWVAAETAGLGNVAVLGIRSDAPVEYDTAIAWEAHVASTVAALAAAGAPPVTAVFSSEHYGDEFAARLGARHRVFDTSREAVTVSGTMIRGDLAGQWGQVAASARLDLATRVIVVGAESTGSTTLSRALVGHYRAQGFERMPQVEEFGRQFTYDLHACAVAAAGHDVPMDDLVWLPEHFAEIAARQTALENEAALASPLVIADTDALATELWERRYLGSTSPETHRAGADDLPSRDVYLVTDHVGVPFEQDGWRDGEHVRAAMTSWFVEELTRRGHSWVLLRGPHDERLRYATRLIDELWRRNTAFGQAPWADRTVLAAAAAAVGAAAPVEERSPTRRSRSEASRDQGALQ